MDGSGAGLPELPELPSPVLADEGWPARLLTGAGALLDASARGAVQRIVERVLIPDAEDVAAVRRSAAPLLDPALQRDPARFFIHPGEAPRPDAVRSRLVRPLREGRVVERRLESGYVPFGVDPAPADRSPVLLEHWRHDRGRGRGTVLALHGFAMGRPRLDAVALFADAWYRRGLDVVIPTLPYHGARTPPTCRFSGEPFAAPDVTRLSEAVREAIWEIRLVERLLRAETGRPVGLLGLSLGGYLSALAAGLYDDLDFVVPMQPPVCIGDLAWGFFSRTRHAREGGPAALSRDELRRAFRVHSPLSHPLRTPRHRVLIVAGRGDRIVPPTHPTALWTHWGEPAIHWFRGSHLVPLGRRGVVDAIARHLATLGIL